jgi:DNA (cytosine-5)-methyltransferase 1
MSTIISPKQTAQPIVNIESNPTVISLFSGAGGMDIGFEKAGFKIAFAADSNLASVNTHNYNSKNRIAHCIDLLEAPSKELMHKIGIQISGHQQPRGIIGGPPCQGFSLANTQRSNSDPRNLLAIKYAEIINKLATTYPIEFFVFENVPGIKSEENKGSLNLLKRKLAQKFYLYTTELNAADFGVPQKRRRFFMVGIRRVAGNVRVFNFPTGRFNEHKTVRSVIENLPEPQYFSRGLNSELIPFHPNHWTMKPKSARFLTPTDAVKGARSFIRLGWDKPSRTVAYGHREIHVHPNGHRRLSIYEAMRLQGFPTEYRLTGTLSEQVTQVSNAVPPPVAESIAKSIRELLSI